MGKQQAMSACCAVAKKQLFSPCGYRRFACRLPDKFRLATLRPSFRTGGLAATGKPLRIPIQEEKIECKRN
jgi:hypothetical protein